MKLYYFPPSPYAQKTLIAVDEKGAQVEREIFFDSRRAADQHDPVGVAAAQRRLDKSYAVLDRDLSTRQWVLGEPFSMGDIAGAAALGMARRPRPFEAHQNLSAYFARLTARPSVARAFAEAQPFLAGRARA